MVHKMLGQAVKDGLLLRNPADAATPPSAREAKAPEMHPWNAAQLAAFLRWAEGSSQNYPLWHTLAMTGMRRGEALALRWRDADLDAATVSVRRSAGMVRNAGEGAGVVEGDIKSGRPRVVDLDDEAIAVLRAWKRDRGAMALQLVTPGSLMFGDIEVGHRNPEHVSRQFTRDVERCGQVPAVRPHDLRHTHATLLLNGPRAGARRVPAAQPRRPGRHDDGLRARAARQPAGGRRHVRPPDQGGTHRMSTPSVNSVSRPVAGANYKSLTWETRCPRTDCTKRATRRATPDQRVCALRPDRYALRRSRVAEQPIVPAESRDTPQPPQAPAARYTPGSGSRTEGRQ